MSVIVELAVVVVVAAAVVFSVELPTKSPVVVSRAMIQEVRRHPAPQQIEKHCSCCMSLAAVAACRMVKLLTSSSENSQHLGVHLALLLLPLLLLLRFQPQ